MALSNWLTRDEWNAVYWAGFGTMVDGAECNNLGDQMRLGIAMLVKAGYTFHGINADEDGNYEKVVQCCDGNEACLAELIDGTFDPIGRAREAVAFAEKDIPMLDLSWLKDAIALFDEEDQGGQEKEEHLHMSGM